jgi:hypothetical protein
MIIMLEHGKYSLFETHDNTKILMLDDKEKFAWIKAQGIGDILVLTKKVFIPGLIVSQGSYRLYKVKAEPDLTDLEHLELLVGNEKWQGYLLPTGLPTDKKKRNRIIPTKEIITKSFTSKP